MTDATANKAAAPRIWHQSVNELDHLDVYKRALEAHAAEILEDDAKVVVHGLPAGSYGGASATAVLGNAFAYHRILDRVIDYAIAAEKQGYDAFVIGSFSEPFLREIRSAVDIPVASLTESGLLLGCSLGSYVALVSNAPAVQWMTKVAVDKHKLAARVLEVAAMEPALDEPALARAYADPAPVIANFTAVAERLVARGADVIIPAEGVLAELLVRHGVREIAGAPVMDVFAVTWAYALMQIRLWSKTGLRVGRSWHHRRDDPALVGRFFREEAR
ncbi:aspartate/glutamate racemase family protein [Bradyrhizobium sp. STM 3562]|uniref:aspartate/glutamate racemase family protein n=1 Tax=Bradyrhizobium sp. STM 3562 TaxID=578924 RepID=UPI00388F8E6D